MPATYLRPFRVRHYECDASGHLNHISYLRYMQTAAFEASNAVGFDAQRYDELGLMWLIRETDITYRQPILAEQQIVVRTWVANFRRVRCQRCYRFEDPQSGACFAEATTSWLLLDIENERPVTVPDVMQAAFFPEGVPEQAARPARFPKPPAQPAGATHHTRSVEWRDVDPAQHVNNAVYLAYMETSGIVALNQFGWSMERAAAAGFTLVARHYQIDYSGQAKMGDELIVSTWISDVKRATAVRHYEIRRYSDNLLLTRGRCLWVWISLETGKPIRIPADFLADFAPNIARVETSA